jgi:WD40 repeat protein
MASDGHAAILGFRVVLRPAGGGKVNHERRPPLLLVVENPPVKPETRIAMQSPPPVLDSRLLNTGLPSSSEVVTAAAFSPDGKRLFAGGSVLRVWDLERNQALLSFPVTPLLVAHAAVWSADGKRALVGGSIQRGEQIRGVAILYDADTGKVVTTFNGNTSPVSAVALSPDGRQILTAAGSVQRRIFLTGGVARSEYQDTEIRRWDVATGKELQRYSGPTAPSRSVAFSPDGKRLFAAGSVEDRAIYSWDVDNSEGNRMDFGNRGVRTYIVLTDDANKAGYVGTNSVLLTYDLNVRNQLTEGIRTQPLPVYPENPVWSRDGRYLACSSMKYANMQGKAPIYLADMLTGRVTTFEGHPLSTKTLAISDDGRFIFSSSKDGNHLWDREHPVP